MATKKKLKLIRNELLKRYVSMYQQESWRYIQPVINEILLDTFHLLFKENNDIKEKFFNFKNAAIEDLNKKWGGGLGTTTGNGPPKQFYFNFFTTKCSESS